MFECMEIAETIYEYVVNPSYKLFTRAYANCSDHSTQKIGEPA